MITTSTADKGLVSAPLMELLGLSTDSKPTEGIPTNSIFFELNTGDMYYFNGTAWAKVGG